MQDTGLAFLNCISSVKTLSGSVSLKFTLKWSHIEQDLAVFKEVGLFSNFPVTNTEFQVHRSSSVSCECIKNDIFFYQDGLERCFCIYKCRQ